MRSRSTLTGVGKRGSIPRYGSMCNDNAIRCAVYCDREVISAFVYVYEHMLIYARCGYCKITWHDYCITMRNSYHTSSDAFDACYWNDWHGFGGSLENKAKPQETVARGMVVQSTVARDSAALEAARRLAGDVWECKRNR